MNQEEEIKLQNAIDAYIQNSISNESNGSFSKYLCMFIMVMTAAVVIATFVLMIILQDLEPLTYLIPAVFTEASVISGFYSYKAKAENQIKLETRKLIIERALKAELTANEEEEEFEE